MDLLQAYGAGQKLLEAAGCCRAWSLGSECI